jgi:hypothetical protein
VSGVKGAWCVGGEGEDEGGRGGWVKEVGAGAGAGAGAGDREGVRPGGGGGEG